MTDSHDSHEHHETEVEVTEEVRADAGGGAAGSRPDPRRAILEMVARGEIGPDEAAEMLAGLSEQPSSDPSPEPPRSASGNTRRIRIKSALRSVVVEGDPDVAEAEPVGEHRAHHEGDELVITADSVPDFDDSFAFAFSSGRRSRIVTRSNKGDKERTLRIRVNPRLALDAEVDAGSVVIRDVHAPIRVRVSAGSAKLTGITEPIDAQVSAGSLVAQGRLDHGDSVINCDAGSVKVDLERGSSVRVRARTSLGKVVLPGAERDDSRSFGFGPSGDESSTIGAGDGRLDITANLGKVVVRIDGEGGTHTSTTSWAWR